VTWDEQTIGNVRLICGDARTILPTLSNIDAVFCDPPYGVNLTAKRAYLGHGKSITTTRAGSYRHPDTANYLHEVTFPILDMCRKGVPVVAVTPGIRHMWAYPQPDDVGCFYSPAGTGMGRWGFTCMHPILYYGKDPYLSRNLGSRPNSCPQIYPNDANDQKHICAKPIAMMLWLVNRISLPGSMVLDPMAGSFTTAVACVQLGRPCVAIEIDPYYWEQGCRRVEAAYAQLDLLQPQTWQAPTQQPLFAPGARHATP
jgi:hypothetical protein